MKILAIIPARGGSKGIKNKNIRPFNGLPLIAHTIKAARDSDCLDRIIVSTEDKKIAGVARRFGAEVPFLRPKRLALDSSEVTDAVEDLLQKLFVRERYSPDIVMLLQPTSPLRTGRDINAAVRIFNDSKADSLNSVCRTENLLMAKDSQNRLRILNPDLLSSANRQKLSAFYKLDGSMINMVKTKIFLKHKSFFAGRMFGYEIPRWRAVDLDEPQDFIVGEIISRNSKLIEKKLKRFK